MPKLEDLKDKEFDFLTVQHREGTHPTRRCPLWRCKCRCGAKPLVAAPELRSGAATSCGCKKIAAVKRLKYRHGLEGSSEYRIWESLKKRCLNSKAANYKDYGGRGIRIALRWHDFVNFYADMGPRPSSKHSIERKENSGDYTPDNCRWATSKEQNRNRRNNRLITFNNETRCLQEWAELKGLTRVCLRDRLNASWSIEDALNTPPLLNGLKRKKKDNANCRV